MLRRFQRVRVEVRLGRGHWTGNAFRGKEVGFGGLIRVAKFGTTVRISGIDSFGLVS